jgi:hypothetical protein
MGEGRGANSVWWEEPGRKETTLRDLGLDCRKIQCVQKVAVRL